VKLIASHMGDSFRGQIAIFHHIFLCGDGGSYPEDDLDAALLLLAAVDRENEKAELERVTANGREQASGNPRL